MAGAGLLACPVMVYDELLDGQDKLANWARSRKGTGLFADPDMAVQRQFQRVCAYVAEHYQDNQPRRRFLGRADPWVIAHVMATGGAVVTHEQKNPTISNKVKIPNVCGHFGVRYIDVYLMLRERGVSWNN